MAGWRDRAACLGEDPELFFPVGATALSQIERARRICGVCEVTEACLGFATKHKVGEGIWGGLTEGERLSMSRRARGLVSSEPRVYVDPMAAHRKIRKALAEGWTIRQISKASGVTWETVENISDYRVSRISSTTDQRIAAANLDRVMA